MFNLRGQLSGKSKVSSSKKSAPKKAIAKKIFFKTSKPASARAKRLHLRHLEAVIEEVSKGLNVTGSMGKIRTVTKTLKHTSKNVKKGVFRNSQSVQKHVYGADRNNDITLVLVNMSLNHSNMKFRHAAVKTFDRILYDSRHIDLTGAVEQALPLLIKLTSDRSAVVRVAAILTIHRINHRYPNTVLKKKYFECLILALIKNLDGTPDVASSSCWALSKLAQTAYDSIAKGSVKKRDPHTYQLSRYFEIIVAKLLEILETPDGILSKLKNAAYKNLLQLISYCSKDCYRFSLKALTVILEKRHHMLSPGINFDSTSDKPYCNQMQSFFCYAVLCVLKKMTPDDAHERSDIIMEALIEILTYCIDQFDFHTLANALIAVAKLVKIIGENFLKYMDGFERFLYFALERHEHYNACTSAIYSVQVIANAFSLKMLPYCDNIVKLLLSMLSDTIHNLMKPQIIHALFDVTFAIKNHFWKYLEDVMPALLEVSRAEFSLEYYTIEFVNELHKRCLLVFSEIIVGLCEHQYFPKPEMNLIKEYIPHIVAFVSSIAQDENRNDGAISASAQVIGSLCWAFDVNALPHVSNPFVKKLITEGKRSEKEKTRFLASYAFTRIRELKMRNSAWYEASRYISKSLQYCIL